MRKLALLTTIITIFAFSSSLLAFEPDTSDELQLDVARAILSIGGHGHEPVRAHSLSCQLVLDKQFPRHMEYAGIPYM